MSQANATNSSVAERSPTDSTDKLAFGRWFVSFMWPEALVNGGPPIRILASDEAAGRQFNECLKHGV